VASGIAGHSIIPFADETQTKTSGRIVPTRPDIRWIEREKHVMLDLTTVMALPRNPDPGTTRIRNSVFARIACRPDRSGTGVWIKKDDPWQPDDAGGARETRDRNQETPNAANFRSRRSALTSGMVRQKNG
jgi:hypothetical protein